MKLNETEYNLLVSLLNKASGSDLFEEDIRNLLALARAAGWSQTTSDKVGIWADQIRHQYEMREEEELAYNHAGDEKWRNQP